MPIVAISDRTLVTVAGPDAEHLLQNIITTDLDALPPGEARPGALLAPQGKILFDFLVSRDRTDGFRLDVRRDVADDFVRRLMLYRLRAKASISKQDQYIVAAAWDAESDSSQSDSTASQIDSAWLSDTRFKEAAVRRGYIEPAGPSGPIAAYTALRVSAGVAESGVDYALGDAFPHDVLLDQLGGVGFKKGCYIGQEVVSRMQHRGTARRRVLIADAEGSLEAGAELRASGKLIGTLGSVAGTRGLAIARIDKVKQALDAGEAIAAGETPVKLSIPAWATFTFPADAAEEA